MFAISLLELNTDIKVLWLGSGKYVTKRRKVKITQSQQEGWSMRNCEYVILQREMRRGGGGGGFSVVDLGGHFKDNKMR